MNKILTLKNALRNDPETAKMIKPSAKNEISDGSDNLEYGASLGGGL